MKKARKEYYTNFIQETNRDPCKLFKSAKTLFCHETELNFPSYHNNSAQLAEDIGNFFVQKIEVIRADLDCKASSTNSPVIPYSNNSESSVSFNTFHTLSEEDVSKLIN